MCVWRQVCSIATAAVYPSPRFVCSSLVCCDGCLNAVHQSCFSAASGAGIPDDDNDWFCGKCEDRKAKVGVITPYHDLSRGNNAGAPPQGSMLDWPLPPGHRPADDELGDYPWKGPKRRSNRARKKMVDSDDDEDFVSVRKSKGKKKGGRDLDRSWISKGEDDEDDDIESDDETEDESSDMMDDDDEDEDWLEIVNSRKVESIKVVRAPNLQPTHWNLYSSADPAHGVSLGCWRRGSDRGRLGPLHRQRDCKLHSCHGGFVSASDRLCWHSRCLLPLLHLLALCSRLLCLQWWPTSFARTKRKLSRCAWPEWLWVQCSLAHNPHIAAACPAVSLAQCH